MKSLIHTFYFVSLKEYENILKKIESDQKFQIQLTEKALAQYDEQQRREALIQRERMLDEQRQIDQKNPKNDKDTVSHQPYYGNTFPGFSIIKDRVIKPLLVATEKVVEYYFQEEKKEIAKAPIASNQVASKADRKAQRSSAGGRTWTTLDETLSDESVSNEYSKLKRKMKRLDINSD